VVSVADVDVFDVDAVDAAHVAEVEVVEGDVLPVGIALGEEFDDAAADVAGRARNCDLWHVVSRGVRVCWWHGLRWISAVVGGGELVGEVANALAERVVGREPCFGEAVEVYVVGRPRMFVAEVRDFEVVVEFVLDDFGDRLDLVVLVVRADVIHVLGPRLGVERGMLVRAGGVLNVDEGPPVGAVTVDGERAVRERAKHEVVDDEVETDARRVAVVGAHAERCPVKAVLPFGLPKASFGVEFRFCIGVQRVGLGGLVDVRAGRPPVEVTRGREDNVLDAEFARGTDDVLGAVVVDVERLLAAFVGAVGARDRGEMDDGVRVPHRVLDVAVLADVAALELKAVGRAQPQSHEVAGRARGEVVEDRDVVDGISGEQLGEERAPDVAAAAGH